MCENQFPPGTAVYVRQTIQRRDRPLAVEVFGVVETWEDLPTGSWFAHGMRGRLWLKRLTLRKADGECSMLVVDDSTEIARLEARKEET